MSIKTNSEKYTLPKHQQPYPMALDDTPNTLLQSPKLHGTCQLQRPQASLHTKHKIQWNETHREETKAWIKSLGQKIIKFKLINK